MNMGKEGAAARRLPFEMVEIGGKGDQHQIPLPREVAGRRLAHLMGSREMDETIGQIDGGTGIVALPCGNLPLIGAADHEEKTHDSRP